MKKFESIIDNCINGNIADCKAQVKKLSKEQRKQLYNYCKEYSPNDANFFFALI